MTPYQVIKNYRLMIKQVDMRDDAVKYIKAYIWHWFLMFAYSPVWAPIAIVCLIASYAEGFFSLIYDKAPRIGDYLPGLKQSSRDFDIMHKDFYGKYRGRDER